MKKRLILLLTALSMLLSSNAFAEVYIEDMFIPDDEYADHDIPDIEENCGMPSV